MPVRSPELALSDYLDEMLHQATEDSDAPAPDQVIAPPVNMQRGVLLSPQLLEDDAGRQAGAARSTIDSDGSTDEAATAQKPAGETAAASGESESKAIAAQSHIDFPVQCLMFNLGSHRMSVPLVQLSGVINWSDGLTRLPESPDWLLGLVKHRGASLRVVDSRRLLDMPRDADCKPAYLLLLGDGDWAITCDCLDQVINLEAEAIQWRKGGEGEMVLGTIRESLCTLLSPPGISAELNSRQVARHGGETAMD